MAKAPKIARAFVADLITGIERRIALEDPADEITASLVRDYGAVRRFHSGTEELKLAKVTATCTAGGVGLLQAWIRRARVALERSA